LATIHYLNEFNYEIASLFAKIQAKENEAKRNIEKTHEKLNLKAALAHLKKGKEKFALAFSKVDFDFSEIL
jgi:hypothetical protein